MRRVEDLNPCGLSPTRFRGMRHKPLGQPSNVYPGGIEPLTFGSANQCSIQLSYGYKWANYIKIYSFFSKLSSFSLLSKGIIFTTFLVNLSTKLGDSSIKGNFFTAISLIFSLSSGLITKDI
jgi:hypothetical protein